MSTTLFALALFGCTDDGTECQRIAAKADTYQTQALCSARVEDALTSDTAMRAEYPTVYAQCMTTNKLAAIGKRTIDINRVNVQFASAR